MHPRLLRLLAVAATAFVVGGAVASETASATCDLPATQAHPLADRAGMLAEYERLPRACLDAIFASCTQAADRGLVDPGSAAACSFGYEALLKKGFGGDFGRLMAWWRSERPTRVQ